MFYEITFPKGAHKVVTFSYDDNRIYDRRLVDMFNRYGLKGTFHVNAGTIGTHEGGNEYITWEELPELYKGHEVACHGYTHPFMSHTSQDQIVSQIWEERARLEDKLHYPIRGMSYPFGDINDMIIKQCRAAGMEYSRTVFDTNSFTLPYDFMSWNPTCHHNKAAELTDRFKEVIFHNRLDVFYIWGHSFEFEEQNTWDMMERLCGELSNLDNVWYASNIEIKDYLTAARNLRTTADGSSVYNPSGITVWLEVNGKIREIPKGALVQLS